MRLQVYGAFRPKANEYCSAKRMKAAAHRSMVEPGDGKFTQIK